MTFLQEPPRLTNTYGSDVVLNEYLDRLLPGDVRIAAESQLRSMGAAAAGELATLAAEAEASPPRLVGYDAWGHRVDRVEVGRAWRELHVAQVRAGLAALPYHGEYGVYTRVVQHALLHLYGPSSAVYTCPVAMTDAAARVLTDHAAPELRDRVVPRLTARDPRRAWTSGQWMTERSGGSDVSRLETVARPDGDGRWRLYGDKWFASATTADCAVVLARPEPGQEGLAADAGQSAAADGEAGGGAGAARGTDAGRDVGTGPQADAAQDGAAATAAGTGTAGGRRGLALFLVERVHPWTGEEQFGRTIRVNRLKDKLGTRALPTAELTLDGAYATPIGDTRDGLKRMAGMLTIARVHNAVAAAASMRRGVDLARAYGGVREAAGGRLLDLPLFAHGLSVLSVEAEASFSLAARVMSLLGRAEHDDVSELEARALRAMVPLAKLLTAKDAVAHASEALEAFGGAGYVEDTGIPRLLRDAQVLPIWEGTTSVLSLDLLRAERTEGAVSALLVDLNKRLAAARTAQALDGVVARAERHSAALTSDVRAWVRTGDEILQAHARDFAVALGRAYTTALLIEHAAIRLTRHRDTRAARVATAYADRWLSAPPPTLPTSEDLTATRTLIDVG